MSARLLFVSLSVLCALPACERPAQPARTTPAQTAAGGDDHEEERNAIHLGEDMVRDLRISTAPVSERAGARQVSVLGQLAADESRYAQVSPPAEGQVLQVLVELNAQASVGTPLARLRSTELGRARAERLSAEARRDLAAQTLERKRMLANERIVAAREVQEADAALRAADADARAAVTRLRALGIAESDDADDPSTFFLRSPIAGRVIDRRVVIGQQAGAGAALFTIADLSRLWLIAQVFERDAVTVEPGTVAHINMTALPGREFDGRVTQVGHQVDAGSRTVPVRIELGNVDGVLRPGMSATARLEVAGPRETVLAVPAAALQRVGQEWLAFVPRTPQEFEMRPVGRGRDLGNDVEVVSGLKAGEVVVVEGAFLLKAEAEKRRGAGDEHGH
jgi:membrane fusion protein, heavy metal efflux system